MLDLPCGIGLVPVSHKGGRFVCREGGHFRCRGGVSIRDGLHYLRGLAKAALEFLLVRMARNIGKIARYKARELLAMDGGTQWWAMAC